MLSDILMLLPKLPDDEISSLKRILMETEKSVLVHQNENNSRLFLIKYDPIGISPSALLNAAKTAGFDVSIAGG